MRRPPRPADRESLRRRRMAEEEEVDEARRLEIGEVAPRELQVGARERRRLLRELERATVGSALEAARKPRARSQGDQLEGEEQQQRLRQRARVSYPRPQHRPEDEDGTSGAGHREQGEFPDVPVTAVPQL